MTATPPLISYDQKESLHCHFNDEQITEMTALVGISEFVARFAAALEISFTGVVPYDEHDAG
jgi:alkylhydroperoxidase family enzyme